MWLERFCQMAEKANRSSQYVYTDGNKFSPYILYSQYGNQLVGMKKQIHKRDYCIRDKPESPIKAEANEAFNISMIEERKTVFTAV